MERRGGTGMECLLSEGGGVAGWREKGGTGRGGSTTREKQGKRASPMKARFFLLLCLAGPLRYSSPENTTLMQPL